jgi:hypothetical protein
VRRVNRGKKLLREGIRGIFIEFVVYFIDDQVIEYSVLYFAFGMIQVVREN